MPKHIGEKITPLDITKDITSKLSTLEKQILSSEISAVKADE